MSDFSFIFTAIGHESYVSNYVASNVFLHITHK